MNIDITIPSGMVDTLAKTFAGDNTTKTQAELISEGIARYLTDLFMASKISEDKANSASRLAEDKKLSESILVTTNNGIDF